MLANEGFRSAPYGGLTEKQQAEVDRAGELAAVPAIAAVVMFVAGLVVLAVALVRRRRTPSGPGREGR